MNAALELRRVISAQYQVVAGTRYVVTAPIDDSKSRSPQSTPRIDQRSLVIKTSVVILLDIQGVVVETNIDTADDLLDSDMQDAINDTSQAACTLDPAGAQAAGLCLAL